MNTGWETFNDWENRKQLRDEREAVRLRKLERVMQDYVGRPNAHSWVDGSALFEEAQEFVNQIRVVNSPSRERVRMETIDMPKRANPMYPSPGWSEAYSMQEAEKLRQSFRPKRPKKKHLSHVRPSRPVPADLVAYARLLKVSL